MKRWIKYLAISFLLGVLCGICIKMMSENTIFVILFVIFNTAEMLHLVLNKPQDEKSTDN